MPQPVRAAIVGTGFMGAVHARAVGAAGGQVRLVAGSSADRAKALAASVPGAEPVDFERVLDSDVDVVHLCTPNHLHHPMARRVLEAGKHVVCEKPLAVSVEQAADLAGLAAGSGAVATVPFVYRFYSSVRLARSRLAADARAPWLLHGTYLQDWLADPAADNWRVDADLGGASRAFGDIGVHWCDLMEFVTGQRITALQATLGTAHPVRGGRRTTTEDGGVVTFRTDAGAIGSLVVSQASAGAKNRLTFSFDGPDASYAFDQEDPERLRIGGRAENRVLLRDPARPHERPGALPAGHPQGYHECFADFVADTYAAVRGDAPDGLPTFADGLRAARVTDAVMRSAAAGSTWTEIPG
ncbi:Gfo/Idh/MocA family protein [Streptomyces sp. NPDC088812]|uniref:Gfo/Idh/MocA family protein n=1 Tax=Streptomyces sp. NPDC088812 TaxID=3365905 RepID=UPI00382D98AF